MSYILSTPLGLEEIDAVNEADAVDQAAMMWGCSSKSMESALSGKEFELIVE